ncbi:MAG: 50S ribosomal protein L10 [Candidatus Saganbacteria bacterium]|nr:50S ribosomal protein L10 [Candidatus Saganbacteria bacterium]
MTDKQPRPEKTAQIEDIRDKAGKSNIMIFTDHKGLTVAQMTALRRKLWNVNAQYKVVKNTLAARTIEGDFKEELKKTFNGPTSVIFGFGDMIGPAKILTAFIKENEKPLVKAAVMEGKLIDASQVKKLAALPGREALLAMAFAGMKSPITGFVRVLQGPIRKFVIALNEIQKKKGA